jgi:micrococcal nuclease
MKRFILLCLCALLSPGPALAHSVSSAGAVQPAPIVIDGDTFRLGLERIRIANIDTPELAGACWTERVAARLAQAELRRLLAQPGDLILVRKGKDKFGRTRAVVFKGRANIGQQMIREGHARAYAGGPKLNWCQPTPA